MTTVAVGFDYSEDSRAAADWAAAYARERDCALVLVHAMGILEQASFEDARASLAAAGADLAARSGLADARVHAHVDYGDACSVMLRCIEAPISASLLVVGTRGHHAHAGLLLGSTSLELAEHALVPVVIVPGQR